MNIKINPRRLTLRCWAACEDIRGQIDEQAEEGNVERICELIYQYIEQANDKQEWGKLGWLDVFNLFIETTNTNKVSIKLPILTVKPKNGNKSKEPWEYDGRTWYFWLNLFAKHYGWSENEIAVLDIDTALALYQEIQLDKQMTDEWQYSLTELAYPYNPSTKKSKFKPLPRPEWMQRTNENYKPKKPIKTMIRKDMLPAGSIINLDMDDSGDKS